MLIADYLIQETLYQGSKFFVYRAKKNDNSLSYILKVLEKKFVHDFKSVQALRNEYNLLTQIDSEYVIKPLEWIENKDGTILVLEDINGKDIENDLKENPFPVKQFIKMAFLIVTALADIHRKNVIHQDINPSNIIWNSATGRLQMIDFDISTKFNTKVYHWSNPEKLQGTLPYISPEQTGRMNRSVDHRTDLYSIGVTFYQMLTGKCPFVHHDPMEVVYSHLARDPEPPHFINETIPRPLSDIVLKLLSKNAEDRYQSAEGLKHDLEMLQKVSSNPEDWDSLHLGEKDFSGKLQIPEKLYGREQEINQLLEAYQRVSQDAKEILLVTGYSGTGKTALVNEIHKPITRDRGYFISGKFDQLNRTVPYFAFIQALNHFCQLLLTEEQKQLFQWKSNILEAVGDLGKVLTDIIPKLELIIGKQPDVPKVGGEESEKRFNYIFQHFFRTISSKDHPMVIFIDDLQWADFASLDLLKVLMDDKQNRHLLIIGAYRDNEVSSSHPLISTIEEIQQEHGELVTISVENLSIEDVVEWCQDTLRTDYSQKIEDLASLIYKKTQGNAFFTIQFLENLYKKKLLNFNFTLSKWIYDLTEIKAQNITDNVIDLLAGRIQTLPETVQEVLKLASCVGNIFDLNTLTVISENKRAENEKLLETALTERLVSPSDQENYQFVHDRIQQAAYNLIPQKDRKSLHLNIGRLLLKTYNVLDELKIIEDAEQHTFVITNHLNIGSDLIETLQEKLELAKLNLKAGQHARISGAYKLGLEYIQQAIQLLPNDCWQQFYDLTLTIFNEAIQISYLCGNFDKMDTYVEIVFKYSLNILENEVAYEYRVLSFISQNKPHLGVDTLLDALNKLGVYIPEFSDKQQTPLILESVQKQLELKGEEGLINLPLMNNPQKQLALRLFTIGLSAILFARHEWFPFITCKMMEIPLKYGLTPETPFIFTLYGMVKNLTGDTSGSYQVGIISMKLLERIPDNEINKPRTIYIICAYLLGWKEHYNKLAQRLKQNYQYGVNVGDNEYACYSLLNRGSLLNRTDMELDVLEKMLYAHEETMAQLKQPISLIFAKIETKTVLNLLCKTPDPAFLDIDPEQDWQEGVAHMVMYSIYIRKIFLAYLFDDYSHVLEYIKAAEISWQNTPGANVFWKTDYDFYRPLAYLQLYTRTGTKTEKKNYLQKARESISTMKKWADFGPVNFLHKYYMMQAELYRVTGKNNQAAEYYDKAIEKAFENEYINEAAIANELAAKFYMENNREKLAAFYLIEAKNCYNRWGAKAKVKHLEDNYPKYLSPSIPGSTLSRGTILSSAGDSTAALDINTILKSFQTLSSEVQLKPLLEKMMQILIQHAGAQRGLFIESKDEQLLVQAEGSSAGVSHILQALPIGSGKAPLSVINYVARSKQQVVFDNISKDTDYSKDNYIQEHQPKSIVCSPVLRKGEFSFIIYLENNLVEGAFTPARLEVLNMLSTQIAISIENAELYETLEEKVRQRTIALEKTHKKITDSVNYASRIQKAVLPNPENIAEFFPDHFLLHKPHSVVSGDFYWIRQIDNKIIVTVADCTGHGIPGALVSMLGMAFLNEIVPLLTFRSQLKAGDILNELRSKTKKAFKQSGKLSDQQEGMDIALCIIDPVQLQLQYAGAYNPLYLIRDNKLIEIKADRMPIGVYQKEQPFTTNEMQFEHEDVIYLFTDGFTDQLDEKGRKKFNKKRFKNLFVEINKEPMSRQKEILIKRLEEWKGSFPQVDDILIFGIRF